MRIYNPSFGLSATSAEKVALKPVNWKTDAIALISNSKPNAREFLAKNSASQPAPKDLIEEVAANYRAALLALGD